MRIVNDRQLKTELDTPCAVAMGFFDGVHIGHAAVIAKAAAYAHTHNLRLCVFTFPQSPKPNANLLLLTEEEKHNQLQLLGIDTCYQPPFSSFSQLSPAEFVQNMLIEEYGAKALFCGDDFSFGINKSGNTHILEQLCVQYGLYLGIAQDILYEGTAVSSTRIRAALAKGAMQDVNAMLGRPYTLKTAVVHGKGLGHTLGFPTINQNFPPNVQTPAFGVYITRTWVNGVAYPSATGWGTRPTVNGSAPSCETFLPSFTGNLYGECPTVEFYKKIADTQKFNSLDELSTAVQGWAKMAVDFWACL